MLKVKAIKIKKGELTMNQNNKNSETPKEVPIPEFKELNELLGCSNCNIDCVCNPNRRTYPSTVYSKMNCIKEKTKIRIIELIAGILLECIFVLLSYFIFHNLFVSILIGILVIAGMCWLDIEFLDEILKEKFKKHEVKRKELFNQKVEETKKQNELNNRLARGETDEFLDFKNNISNVTGKLEKLEAELFYNNSEYNAENESEEQSETEYNNRFVGYVMNSLQNKKSEEEIENSPEMDVNFKIKDLFDKFIRNLNSLNIQIIPSNFKYSYIQAFYADYLPSFCKSINVYCEKKSQETITPKEEEAFEKLLNSFNVKVEQVIQSLNEQDEISFLSKMEDLQNSLNSLKKSEE